MYWNFEISFKKVRKKLDKVPRRSLKTSKVLYFIFSKMCHHFQCIAFVLPAFWLGAVHKLCRLRGGAHSLFSRFFSAKFSLLEEQV